MDFRWSLKAATLIDWHLGKESEIPAKPGWKYRNVTRAQWEAHKTNAPEVEDRDRAYFQFYEGAVNTGYVEDKYVLCRIAGAKWPITADEHYYIFGATD